MVCVASYVVSAALLIIIAAVAVVLESFGLPLSETENSFSKFDNLVTIASVISPILILSGTLLLKEISIWSTVLGIVAYVWSYWFIQSILNVCCF